jgi:hypothetical protein
MNQVGMWLVKSQTIGTTVSAVTVTDAFSADYENYKIIVSGGTASATAGLSMTFGTTTTTIYDLFQISGTASSNTITGSGLSNQTNFANVVRSGTDGLNGTIEVFSPFAATRTQIHFNSVRPGAVTAGNGWGTLKNNTSYTDFTLTSSTGTVTGGTIYVYGYHL